MAENEPISTSGGAATAAAMLNQPIVIDCGTSSMKAGFAGGTKPKVNILCLNSVLCVMVYEDCQFSFATCVCVHLMIS